MKKVLVAGACAVLFLAATAAVHSADKKVKSIKEVMQEGHKQGKPPLCGVASKGVIKKEEAEKLLSLYEDMAQGMPKKGDAESWKAKCEALISATKKLVADPKDNADYKKAVNCKACHDAHK